MLKEADTDKASQIIKQGVTYLNQIQDFNTANNILINCGDILFANKEYDEAISHYQQALKALDYRKSEMKEQIIQLLLKLGEASWKSSDRHQALQYFYRYTEYIDGDEDEKLIEIYYYIGFLESGENGIKYLEKSLDLYDRLKSNDVQAKRRILAALGRKNADSRPELCIKYLEEALELDLQKNEVTLNIYSQLATTLAKLERFEEARINSEKALELCLELGVRDELLVTRVLNAARYNFMAGNTTESLDFYLQASQITERLQNPVRKFEIFNEVAQNHYQLQDFDSSAAFFQKALQIYQSEIPNPTVEKLVQIYSLILRLFGPHPQLLAFRKGAQELYYQIRHTHSSLATRFKQQIDRLPNSNN